jgi:hypothetical protein
MATKPKKARVRATSLAAPKPKVDVPREVDADPSATVTVHIPKAFKLIDDQGIMHNYAAGTDEMPIAHAEHWYSQANGVEIHEKA